MRGPVVRSRPADLGEPEAADGAPVGLGVRARSVAAARRGRAADPLIAALVRYVEALDARYPGGPDQLRREALTPEQPC